LLWIFTHDKHNLNITGGSTRRGIFCTVLPDGPEFADTVKGGWFAPWTFSAESGFGLQMDQVLQTLSREVDLALGDSVAQSGFGLLRDHHLQKLSRESDLALEDLAEEPGFGLYQQLSEEDCLMAGYSP